MLLLLALVMVVVIVALICALPWYFIIIVSALIVAVISGIVSSVKCAKELNKENAAKRKTINISYSKNSKDEEFKENTKN